MQGSKIKVSERMKFSIELNGDVGAGDLESTVFIDARDYQRAYARLRADLVAGSNATTLEFRQATDSAGTGSKLLGTQQSYTTTSEETVRLEADVDLIEMDKANGFYFIGIKATCADSAAEAAGFLALADPRYGPVSNTVSE